MHASNATVFTQLLQEPCMHDFYKSKVQWSGNKYVLLQTSHILSGMLALLFLACFLLLLDEDFPHINK